jgi:glycosyltransferase involved in cell wall biosynthesis
VTLRILHLSEKSDQSPYLDAAAAATRWLPDELRKRGHAVVVRPADEFAGGALDAVANHFDVVHIHGPAPEGAIGTTPTLRTAYDVAAARGPVVALSWRQARRWKEPPAAVVPAAIAVDSVDPAVDRGDHFVVQLSPRDRGALDAALHVAQFAERELVVLSPSTLPDCKPPSSLVRFVGVEGEDVPAELTTAAAYLAFGRATFDVGAVTAMAAGVPVLTLDDCPTAEVIVSGESGYTCASHDEAKRAAGRLDLLDARLARQRAQLLFDAGAAAARYEAIYEALISQKHPSFRHPELVMATAAS